MSRVLFSTLLRSSSSLCSLRHTATRSPLSSSLPAPLQIQKQIQKQTHDISSRQYSSRPIGDSEGKAGGKEKEKEKRKKTTVLTLKSLHERKEPISMLTAHDYPSALYAEKAGIEIILVGDSLAMVALGYPSTTSITMEEMLHHCRAVARGASLPFLVGDMPFGSYQTSPEAAVANAIRFVKEGNMEAVKIEGGIEMAETARRIVNAGVPVLGHIGLTPQSQSALGGYRVQGKTASQALKLYHDAQALKKAGCFGIVLEAVPNPVAKIVAEAVNIPTIGIGAGPHTSGQVLVQLDMLGIFDRFVPRFCKVYSNMGTATQKALEEYHADVKKRTFPSEEHCYPIDSGEIERFKELIHKEEAKSKH